MMSRLRMVTVAQLVVVGSATAQELGVYSDSACSFTNVYLAVSETTTVYIGLRTDRDLSEAQGAVFRVAGLPDAWEAVAEPNPEATQAFGDPFELGAAIAFPECSSDPCVLLYTVTLVPTTQEQDVFLRVIGPLAGPGPPSCQAAIACDSPEFTRVCVSSGLFCINATGDTCVVGVAKAPWTSIKLLFR